MQLHSDSASYFRSAAMAEVAKRQNVNLTFSAPHSQWLNGKAERMIGLIGGKAKATLYAASLPESDWMHAWASATQMHNIIDEMSSPDPCLRPGSHVERQEDGGGRDRVHRADARWEPPLHHGAPTSRRALHCTVRPIHVGGVGGT